MVKHRFNATNAVATVAILAMLAGPATGCSYLFVTGPPSRVERGEVVDCTSSSVAPTIDMLVASWQIVRIILALSASDAAYVGSPINRGGDIAIGAGMLMLFGSSAIVGFSQTSDCREVLAEDTMPRARPRPRAVRPPSPNWKLGPPPPSPEKLEEKEEEAAVRARAAERARAAREGGGPDAGANVNEAPAVVVPAKLPESRAPAVPQRADSE